MSTQKELQQSFTQFLAKAKPWTMQNIHKNGDTIEISLVYGKGALSCGLCGEPVDHNATATPEILVWSGVIERQDETKLTLKVMASCPVVKCSSEKCDGVKPRLPWIDEDEGVPMFTKKTLIPWNQKHSSFIAATEEKKLSFYARQVQIDRKTLCRYKKDGCAPTEPIEKIENDLNVDLRIPFSSVDLGSSTCFLAKHGNKKIKTLISLDRSTQELRPSDANTCKQLLALIGVWRGKLRQILESSVAPEKIRNEQTCFLDYAIEHLLSLAPLYPIRLAAFAETFSGTWQCNGTAISKSEIKAAIDSSFQTLWDKHFGPGGRFHHNKEVAINLIKCLVDTTSTPPKKREPYPLRDVLSELRISREILRDVFQAKLKWIEIASSPTETVKLTDFAKPLEMLNWANGRIEESPAYIRDIFLNTNAIPNWAQWLVILQNNTWSQSSKDWMESVTIKFAKAFVQESPTLGIAELTPRLNELRSLADKSKTGDLHFQQMFIAAVQENIDAKITSDEYWKHVKPSAAIKQCLIALAVSTTQSHAVSEKLLELLQDCYLNKLAPISVAVLHPSIKEDFMVSLRSVQKRNGKSNEAARLRSNAVLAQLDSNLEWAQYANQILEDLSEISGESLQEWLYLFRPIKNALNSAATRLYREKWGTPIQRQTLMDLRIEYAVDLPSLLDVMLDSDADHFDRSFKKLWDTFSCSSEMIEEQLNEARSNAEMQLANSYNSSDKEWVLDSAIQKLATRLDCARRIANSVIAQALMTQKLMPDSCDNTLLGESGLSHRDPNVVSYLVHGLKPAGFEISRLYGKLFPAESQASETKTDPTLLRNALRTIAEYAPQDWVVTDLLPGIINSLDTLRFHEACGVSATADWLLRTRFPDQSVQKHTRSLDSAKASLDKLPIQTTWFCSTRIPSHAMALMKAADIQLGSPASSKYHKTESYRKASVNRTFAISVKHVTFDEFKRWIEKEGEPNEVRWGQKYLEKLDVGLLEAYPLNKEEVLQPAFYVDFVTAARFANWLSDEEKLTSVFDIVETTKGNFTASIKDGNPNGYRMPTSAEYEFAVRGETNTDRFFGDDDALLRHYAWYNNLAEAPKPASLLPPSQNGIFDAYGNEYSWILHDPISGDEDYDDIISRKLQRKDVRAVRGSCILDPARESRTGYEYEQAATHRKYFIAFRLARTIAHAES